MKNITKADIAAVERAPNVQMCKKLMFDILDDSSVGQSKRPIHPRKVAYLKNRVAEKTTKDQVLAILYNMILQGEGLGSLDTWYQKNIKGWY